MQHEGFFVGASEGIDELFVVAGAQRGNNQSLSFTAGEQGRPMGCVAAFQLQKRSDERSSDRDHRYGHRS